MREERGVTTVEYALILAAVALVSVPAAAFGVQQVTAAFESRISANGGCAGIACDLQTTGDQLQMMGFVGPTGGQVGTFDSLTATSFPSDVSRPITFDTATGAVCSVIGSTVQYLTVGTCEISARQVGDAVFAPASISRSVTVIKGDQIISFSSPVTSPNPVVGTTGVAAATAVSPEAVTALPVAITTATPSVCTVSGSAGGYSVSYLTAGTCTLNGNQVGDTNWNAAPQVTRSVTVVKATPVITWAAPATGTVGGTLVLTTYASSPSPVAITFSSGTAGICTVSGSTVSYIAVGVCTVRADQAANANWNAAAQATDTITIGVATPSITWAAPATGTVGGTLVLTTYATSPSPVAITFSSGTASICTVSGSTVTYIAVGVCTVRADQAANANWNAAAQATDTITISKGSQTITFADPANTTMASSPLSVPATASSGLDVTLTPTDSTICTVSGSASPFSVNLLKVGTCTLTARQTGDANWSPATAVPQSFTIGKGNQVITISAPATGTVGVPATVSATSDSGLTVSVSVGTSTVCTLAGTTVTFKTVGTCTVTATQAGNTNWNVATPTTATITVKRSQTVTITAPATGKVGVGGTVSATSDSGLTVSVSVAPSSVCTLAGTTVTFKTVGTCTVTASQAGNATYNPDSATDTITVGKGAPAITWAAPTTGTVGGTLVLTTYATSPSPVAITFSSGTPSICTMSGSTVTYIAVGTCTVRADQALNADWDAAVQATDTIVISDVPGAPTGLVGTAGAARVALSWTAPASNGAAITDYVVQYKRDSSNTWLTFNDGTSATASATVTGLLPGVTYDFQVAATNSVGTGAYSATYTTTNSTRPTGACAVLPDVVITGAGGSPQTEVVLPSDLAGGKVSVIGAKTSANNTGTVAVTSPTSGSVTWSGYSNTKTWTGTYSYTATGCTGTASSNNLSISSN